MEQTSLEELKRTAASGAYRRIPIWREIFSDIATPVQVLKKLLAVSDHCFLLESAEDNKRWGRYSFLGFDPAMELTCMNHQVTITTDHVEQFETENPAQVIARVIEENRAPRIKNLPPLTGGLVGYFAYDYIKYAEPTLRLDAEDQEKFRDVDLMLFDKMIAFDHYRQKIILICNSRISEADVQAEGGQTAGAAAATDLQARGKSARAAATDAPVSAAAPDALEAVYRAALQTLDQMQDIIEKGAEKNVPEGRRCSNELAWSRVIWDITTVAWLLDERFMEDYLMPSPIPEYDGHYSVDPKRHLMRYVYHVNRDKVFSDLFTKLANFG